jgi:hypothetical protein
MASYTTGVRCVMLPSDEDRIAAPTVINSDPGAIVRGRTSPRAGRRLRVESWSGRSVEAAPIECFDRGPARIEFSDVRIATWNLERGGRTRAARRAQEEALRELERDVLVLTEPGPSFEATAGTVTSPRLRASRAGNESWVAVVGESVAPAAIEVPFERMAVAAIARAGDTHLVVYGSVLPWGTFRTHAPQLAHDGETSLESFLRVLREQMANIEELRPLPAERFIIGEWGTAKPNIDYHVDVDGHYYSLPHTLREAARPPDQGARYSTSSASSSRPMKTWSKVPSLLLSTVNRRRYWLTFPRALRLARSSLTWAVTSAVSAV